MPPRKKTEAPETEQVETNEAEAPETEQVETNEAEAPETEQASSPVDLPDAAPLKPTPQVPVPRVYGATFAERKAAREAADAKQVTGAQAENKAVQK
jgi:hypothetical protein